MSCVRVPGGVRSGTARVFASCVVVSLSAGCAIDVTEYTPFATSTKTQATASDTPARASTTDVVSFSPAASESSASPDYTASSGESRSDPVTVRQGDTLYGLSRQHGVPVSQLIASNDLERPYTIQPGQTLVIPSGSPTAAGAQRRRTASRSSATISVARGDTVYGLARRHNVGVGQLIAANGLQAPYDIRPGQSLQLPAGGSYDGRETGAPDYTASIGARSRAPRASSVRVARGDTLYSIARRHGVPVRQLIAVNQIPAPFHVRTGQRLLFSGQVASADTMVKPVAASPVTGLETGQPASVGAAAASASAAGTVRRRTLEPVDGERQPVSIANRYKIPAATTRAYNKVANQYQIMPGQTVLIPF